MDYGGECYKICTNKVIWKWEKLTSHGLEAQQ